MLKIFRFLNETLFLFLDDATAASNQLLFAEMNIISDQECRNFYSYQFLDSVICAVGYCESDSCNTCCKRQKRRRYINLSDCATQNTCNGDSGSALITIDSCGNMRQIGVVSFGSAASCERGYPSGFAQVYYFRAFIQQEIDCFEATGSFCT